MYNTHAYTSKIKNSDFYLFKLNDFNIGQVLVFNSIVNNINTFIKTRLKDDTIRNDIIKYDDYFVKLSKVIDKIYSNLSVEYTLKPISNNKKDNKSTSSFEAVLNHIQNFFKDEISLSNDVTNDIKTLQKDIETLSEAYLIKQKYNKNKELLPPKDSTNEIKIDALQKHINNNKKLNEFFTIPNNAMGVQIINSNDTTEVPIPYTLEPVAVYDINTSEVSGYNEDFNTEKFSYLAQQWTDFDKSVDKLNTVYIIFSNSLNMSVVINSNEFDNKEINTFETIIMNINNFITDLVFIDSIEKVSENVVSQIINYFDNNNFNNLEDIKNKVNGFKVLNNITLPEQKTEKELVIGFINQNYILSTDPTYKMKSSVIQDEIEKGLRLFVKDKVAFSKRISNYLLEIKLNKKRYSDGIYYYGIQNKNDCINFNKNAAEMESDYENRLKEYTV